MTTTRTLLQALEHADERLREGKAAGAAVWPTGFSPLDQTLGGGLRAGELTLLGGAPGLGKTTFALQVARNAALAGRHVLYVCYEHREQDLLERLLGLELGLQGADDDLGLRELRQLCADVGSEGLVERLAEHPSAVTALECLSTYAARLSLAVVAGRRTSLEDLGALVLEHAADRPLVVVDYLQKVRAPGDPAGEDERVTQVVEGLKDLALEADVPLLAIVASDKSGVGGGRTRLRDLRGSTALAYEADVALLLNDKFRIVARHHLVYGTTNADEYHQFAVCSVEKNRSGRDDIDLEFRKHFDHGHFDADGRYVAEKLIDDRVHVE